MPCFVTRLALCGFLLALAQLAPANHARAQDRWVRLAAIEVRPGQDIAEFEDAWQWSGQFKALRWQVRGGSLAVTDVFVSFSDSATAIHPQPRGGQRVRAGCPGRG